MKETIKERLAILETELSVLKEQNKADHKKMLDSLENLKSFKIAVIAISSFIATIISGILTWLK